jgi:hypothetical protein
MSIVGCRFFYTVFLLFDGVTGRDGARQRRRVIRLISGDGVPPDVRPSGACLARGPRLPAGLVTRSRVAPHRGGGSSAAREHTCSLMG